jgi:hypothetical protein
MGPNTCKKSQEFVGKAVFGKDFYFKFAWNQCKIDGEGSASILSWLYERRGGAGERLGNA